MNEIIHSLPIILGALLCVTFIDTVGAVASRKLKFNYGYLTVFSLTIYTLIGYGIAGMAGLNMMLLASLTVGLYDATVGWKLSQWCRANTNLPKELEEKLTTNYSLMVMALIAPVFAYIGYCLR
jgi:lipopolysaccharide export LptBFGC system permease protein LptF